MKVKYIKDTVSLCLTNNKIYNVIALEKGWYRIVDDSGEDYLYPPENFEIVSGEIEANIRLDFSKLDEEEREIFEWYEKEKARIKQEAKAHGTWLFGLDANAPLFTELREEFKEKLRIRESRKNKAP